MRRNYQSAQIVWRDGGYAVFLDTQIFRTPQQQPLILPHFIWAEKIAAECNAQGDTIIPATMPYTQVFCTLRDRVLENRQAAIDTILAYANTDAICYWQARPKELAQLEKSVWGAAMDAVAEDGFTLHPVLGLNVVPQPAATGDRLSQYVAGWDDWTLGLWQSLCSVSGSAWLGYLWLQQKIDMEKLLHAAFLPEIFRCQQAGEDAASAPHLLPKFADLRLLAELMDTGAGAENLCLSARISGRVQGVGYRRFVQRAAQQRGVLGYVENLMGGAVEAVIIGPEAAVNSLLEACADGPSLSRVDSISLVSTNPPGMTVGFQIR
jgi:chaperone required for assembly of F1-ATPase/acylphosphatase